LIKGADEMGIMHKLMDFLGLAEGEANSRNSTNQEFDYEEDDWFNEDDVLPKKRSKFNPPTNVVNLQSVKQNTKMILVEPHTYDETQEMADHLRNRRPIVVNLQRLHHDQAKRVVDFLSGTVYAIGGDIQKIGTNIFLCTPDNVEIQGSISEMIQEEIQSRMR
jgi:cell division inhibitor SepF